MCLSNISTLGSAYNHSLAFAPLNVSTHSAGIFNPNIFISVFPGWLRLAQLHFSLSIPAKEVRPHSAIVNLVAVRIEASLASALLR